MSPKSLFGICIRRGIGDIMGSEYHNRNAKAIGPPEGDPIASRRIFGEPPSGASGVSWSATRSSGLMRTAAACPPPARACLQGDQGEPRACPWPRPQRIGTTSPPRSLTAQAICEEGQPPAVTTRRSARSTLCRGSRANRGRTPRGRSSPKACRPARPPGAAIMLRGRSADSSEHPFQHDRRAQRTPEHDRRARGTLQRAQPEPHGTQPRLNPLSPGRARRRLPLGGASSAGSVRAGQRHLPHQGPL